MEREIDLSFFLDNDGSADVRSEAISKDAELFPPSVTKTPNFTAPIVLEGEGFRRFPSPSLFLLRNLVGPSMVPIIAIPGAVVLLPHGNKAVQGVILEMEGAVRGSDLDEISIPIVRIVGLPLREKLVERKVQNTGI